MPQLDGIRAIAALGVMIAHFQIFRRIPILGHFGGLAGDVSVTLFFVLSGFLITGILLRCRQLVDSGEQTMLFTARQFYLRRALRIFPLYYAVVMVLLVFGVQGAHDYIWWLLTYTLNFGKGFVGSSAYPLNHFWTLGVEEQFYLAWPCIVLVLTPRQLFRFSGACCLLGVAYRVAACGLDGNEIAVTQFTPACLDPLCAGAMLAACRHTGHRIPFGKNTMLFCFALTIALLVLGSREQVLMFYRLPCAVCFVWLIDRAACGRTGQFGNLLGWRPVAYIGKISYGIYVYHYLVLWAFGSAPVVVPVESVAAKVFMRIINFAILVGVTVVAAAVSWELFERPLNQMKRFFPYAFRSARHAEST